MFDVVITGGQVIDGTGAARRRADVAIVGDRIVALGQLPPGTQARTTIDAGGLIVAPGFIDVHAHVDGWLLKTPHLAAKTTQGFTTEILMSDGISYAPVSADNYRDWFLYLRSLNGLEQQDYRGWHSIEEYLALLDRRTAQNVVAEIPYANVRALAAGWGRAPLDDTHIKMMRHEVERAMQAGAVGISTGLDYVCECFATTDEIAAVCAAMAPWSGIYVTHVRYKLGTLRGVQEAVEIGRRADVPVHISHLKAGTRAEADEILDYIDRVAIHEVDFSFDVYPYLSGSTMVNYLLPYEAWEDGPLGVCRKLRDPALRRRFEAMLAVYALPLEQIVLAWTATKSGAGHQGRTLADYVAASGKNAADAICDLLIDENLAALTVLVMEPDALIEPFLAHERSMLGSDGILFADGRVHPRVYGSAPRILGPLVRDRRLFTLEAAVRKMSGYPAARFGLAGRGVLREGAFADVVVFDAERITDRATYENPHQLSVGIEHVLVNGTPIICNTEPLELGPEWPGRALRFNPSTGE